MNKAIEGGDALRFPFAEAPTFGSLLDVAPGVKWLRAPLPLALNHVNLWVLEDAAGWTLVDTGMNAPATQDMWHTLFAGPLKSKPVVRLIATHFHPDHLGFAGWLAENYGAALSITDSEWHAATAAYAMLDEDVRQLAAPFHARLGFPRDVIDEVAALGNTYSARVYPLPKEKTRLDPALPVTAGGTSWDIVVGRGHSPELAALHSLDLGVLISGDQILPGISPNISVRPESPESDPLRDFLESLTVFRELPASTLVLPSHKLPFYGLQTRVDQLAAHHRHRLSLAKTVCMKPASGYDVFMAMFPRKLDPRQLQFAIGETVAHLNYLLGAGQLARDTVAEVYQYRTLA